MKHLFDKLLIAVLAGGLALLVEAAAPTMFVDSLELKVGNVSEAANPEDQTTFENLPVFVKVYESDEKFPGFMISRSGGLDGNGSDIRFSQDNKILPHEMVAADKDENDKYVSFSFWVKVPRVTAGSTITMHWGVKDNERPPINRPKEVWSDYVGVWHKAARSDKTVSDASGNGNTLTRDTSGNLMFPGEYLKLLGSDKSFTLTGYYIGDGVESFSDGNKNVIFGTWNRLGNANGRGWGADAWLKTRMVFRASAGGDDYSQYNIGSGNYLLENETHLAYVAEGTANYWGYVNGTKAGHVNGYTINHDGENPLRIVFSDWSAREVRLAKVARPDAWIAEEIAAQSETYVVKTGEHHVASYTNAAGKEVLENYWLSEPKMNKTALSESDLSAEAEKLFNIGQALYGDLEWWLENASDTDESYGQDFKKLAASGHGAYRIVIRTGENDSQGRLIKRLEKILYFAYVGEVTSQELGANRTMLFNDLVGKDPSQGVQYWSTAVLSKPEAGEEASDDSSATEYLAHPSGWQIHFGKIGNAREEDRNVSGTIDALDPYKNYLPFGVDACDYSDSTKIATSLVQAGAAVLFNYSDNTEPAAVYSPLFTDGVGEIYFDAVNMDTDYRNRLELQYLTGEAAKTATLEKWVNDHETASNLEILVIKEGEKVNTWTGRSFVPLMMTKNGEEPNQKSFYRVRAKLNISGPVIFRIARTDTSWGAGGLTGPGKILVDNIHVSEPTTEVELHRLEETWDATRDFGKNLLGDRGTLSKPFPKVGDKDVKARVRVTYKGFGSDLVDRYKNVAALIFKYRLRYLNSSVPGDDGSEKSIPMSRMSDDDTIFETDMPLSLGNQPCDVEYSFEYAPNPTVYDYVDYYGLTNARFEASGATEATTLPYKGAYDRTPALGHDFFFRLREGASDYEQLEMIWRLGEGDIVTNRLHLVEDHLWTGAIAVANAEKNFSFKLRGVNYQGKGESSSWEMENENEAAKDSPYSAIAELRSEEPDEEAGFKVILADVVKDTRQFVVRFDDTTGAFSLCRGDYQDFNSWTDAAANAEGKFVAHSGQNGADPIASTILQKRFPTDIAKNVFEDWKANVVTEDIWRESFTTGYGDVQAALTDVLQGTDDGAKTLNGGWLGHNFMYVNESLNNLFSESYESRAALLVGGGSGTLESDASEDLLPDGIGEINFRARLGQQHTYDRVSTYNNVGRDSFTPYDYLVSARVAMSTTATSASDLGFDGQGAVSIFAYHTDGGSYEFRMKRLTRNQIELGLYRWYQEIGNPTMKVKELYRVVRNATGLESDRNSGRTPGTVLCSDKLADGKENTTAYVAFLSVRSILDEDDNVVKNQLYAGFTNNNGVGSAYSNRPSVATEIAGHEMTWHSIYVQDSTFKDSKNRDVAPLEGGTFGFLSTDCPARFMRPTIHQALDASYNKGKNVAYAEKITLPQVIKDTTAGGTVTAAKFWSLWGVKPSADIGKWSVIGSDNKYRDYYGIVTPEVVQKLIVSTRPVGSSASAWSVLETKEISSFNYSDISVSAHSAEKVHVKLATGTMTNEDGSEQPRCDVILDDIEMTQWHAGTSDNLYQKNDEFVFTGVWVEGEGVEKKAEFWPLRVSTNEYETVRAPLLEKGIGAISFSYDLETLDPNAELVIELMTTDDDNQPLNPDYVYSYTNDRRYNGADVGDKYWKVFKKFKYEDLYAAGGHITEYIGKRSGVSLLRLRVPQDVIVAAHNQNDGEYGRIDLKSIVVWDEPNVDERAWTAWNVRVANAKTAEEEYGAYDKLLNIDSWLDVGGTSGMSMELNNGPVDSAEPALVVAHRPYIQSPALTTPDGQDSGVTIGEINFRARKSGTDDAYVGVYAVTDFSSDESKNDESKMSLIETVKLASTAWQNFTIKNTASGAKAVRLAIVDGTDAEGKTVPSGRALFDELSVTERVDPKVVVTFARPFRNNLNNTDAIPDNILASPDEQPLCCEEWGIQCTLALKELEKVIKPETVRVFCDYYVENFMDARYMWGYAKWSGVSPAEGKRGTIELAPATNVDEDSSSLVYRMTHDTGYIPPIREVNSIVQYHFRITFETIRGVYDEKHPYEESIFNPADPKQWTTPEWYYPVDFNKTYPGSAAAYTILDNVAPKRAWINEVNVWDGTNTPTDYDEELTNQWIELAIPAGVDLSDWSLEAVSANNESGLKTYKIMTFGEGSCKASKSSSEPFAFYIAAHPESTLRASADGLLSIPSPYGADGSNEGIFREGANDGGGYFFESVPFALRLVRPTGVVDHEILVAGYKLSLTGYDTAYGKLAPGDKDTGHNKVLKVGTDDGAAFTAEGESVTLSMTNVAKVSDLTISDRWQNTLKATPGALNVNQEIDDNYLIEPNDNTVTISLTVEGDGIEQDAGTGSGYTVTRLRTTFTKGSTTPIVVKYRLAPWYEIASVNVLVNDQSVVHDGVLTSLGGGEYEFSYLPTERCEIRAVSRNNSKLMELIGENNAYEDAILKWMREKYPNLDPDGIYLTEVWGANPPANGVEGKKLSLTEMYWIGADPSEPNWALSFYVDSPHPDVEEGYDVVKVPIHVLLVNYAEGDRTDILATKKIETIASKVYGVDSAAFYKNRNNADYPINNWSSNGPTIQLIGCMPDDWKSSWGEDLTKNFYPVMHYMIDEKSFDENGERVVVLPDPFGPNSVTGLYYKWTYYKSEEYKATGGKVPNVWYKLELEERKSNYDGYLLDMLR